MEKIRRTLLTGSQQIVNLVLTVFVALIICGNLYFNANAYPSSGYWLTTAFLPVILLLLNDINQVFQGVGRRFAVLVIVFSNMIALFVAFVLANGATSGYYDMLELSKNCFFSFGISTIVSSVLYTACQIARGILEQRSLALEKTKK